MTGAIIAVEGANGAGKTVLCRHLVEAHGARYMHSRLRPNILHWHAGMIRRALRLRDRGETVVLDRHFISDQVYGPVFQGHTAYPDAIAEEFDAAIRSGPHAYVLCVPTDLRAHLGRAAEQIIQRYDGLLRGNVAHPGDNLVDRFIRYGDFATGDRVVVHYDLDRDGGDLPRFAKKLMKRIG